MANLCHLFLHQQSFSSSISLSSIFKPTQPDVFSQMNQICSILRGWTSKIFQCLCMWLFLLIILVVIFIFSNLSSPLLNMKRFLLKNISTEDSLTNLTTHLSEKHGQDSSVERKKKISSCVMLLAWISRLIRPASHSTTSSRISWLLKYPAQKTKYLSLQRTTHTGTIQASMLHISARDQLKAWTGTSVFLSKVTFPTSLQISLCSPNESAFMCFSSAPTKWCIAPCLLDTLAMRMKGKTWVTQEEATRCLFFWDSQQARQVLPAGIRAYGLKTYVLWDNIRSFFSY